MSTKMRLTQMIVVACLAMALITAPVSAADGSIIQGIFDWFSGLFPGETPATPATYADHGFGSQIVVKEPPVMPGEGKGEPGKDPDPSEGRSEPDLTVGTVYAVDYHTSPAYGSAPLMIRFCADEFVDDLRIDQFAWDFGDGFSSTETDHFHSYTREGVYTATLQIVNTTTGWTADAQIPVYVEASGVVPLPENGWEEM